VKTANEFARAVFTGKGFAAPRKSAQERGPDTHGTMAADRPVRGRVPFYWFIGFGLVLGSTLVIPALPYMVDNFSPELLYAVIPAQVLVVAAFLVYLRRRVRAARPAPDENL
jgi:hypothetical protein